MNKKILAVAILGVVFISVSFSGCLKPSPDLRLPSSVSAKWLGGTFMSAAGLKVSGQLLDQNSNQGIPGKPIVLYGSNDASFNQPVPQVGETHQVQLQAQTTDSHGKFAFTLRSSDDKYLVYAVAFLGDSVNNAAYYKPSGSAVGGYHALSAVADQLNKDLLTLPSSAFAPGARVALLATLGTASLQIRLGQYSSAAATLNSAFLKRMDGYATSRAPDKDDSVKTNQAQYQMYYLAYITVKDCQWLSGGQDVSLASAPPQP